MKINTILEETIKTMNRLVFLQMLGGSDSRNISFSEVNYCLSSYLTAKALQST